MSARTEVLQRLLDAERTELDTNLKALATRAHTALDWQTRVRANLVPTIGAAVAAGVLVGLASRAPRHRRPPLDRSTGSVAGPSTAWQRLVTSLLAVTSSKAGEVADRVFNTMADRWLAPSPPQP
jgi:hypothetical protein